MDRIAPQGSTVKDDQVGARGEPPAVTDKVAEVGLLCPHDLEAAVEVHGRFPNDLIHGFPKLGHVVGHRLCRLTVLLDVRRDLDVLALDRRPPAGVLRLQCQLDQGQVAEVRARLDEPRVMRSDRASLVVVVVSSQDEVNLGHLSGEAHVVRDPHVCEGNHNLGAIGDEVLRDPSSLIHKVNVEDLGDVDAREGLEPLALHQPEEPHPHALPLA
mmetsp:Transcript_20802/g.49592  ORF Transcript_20802/g.49592 Transcript_20802/m.49592 type:complete len:214 (-) Transcript_20802:805-1446(-)